MQFCENCDNILIPRNKKLYCKACDMEFDLPEDSEEYKIVKTIPHDEKDVSPVVVREGLKGEKISSQDRKAYEEFFVGGELDGY